jgi:signal recognition particle receptor subunit beta
MEQITTTLTTILGKDALTRTQLTYLSYTVIVFTTLLTIQVFRKLFAAAFGATHQTKGKKHILLVGAEKTGKTVLANVIVQGKKPHHDTVTSMEPTRRTGMVDGAPVTLTDFPGSAQARNASLTTQLANATGVVFLIDGRFGSMTDEARASAALMKRVLVHATFRRRKIPLLVAFNKIDLLAATTGIDEERGHVGDTLQNSAWLVRQKLLLQKELDAIKVDMLTTTGDHANTYQLGTEQSFEFDMDVESKVTFCCCTTETGRAGVQDVVRFCKERTL